MYLCAYEEVLVVHVLPGKFMALKLRKIVKNSNINSNRNTSNQKSNQNN